MLDVHPPHHSTRTWSDFFIHIATICVGLLIAIGLEQSIEVLHRHHERIALQADLRTEATSNRQIIAHDLNMRNLSNPGSIKPPRQPTQPFPPKAKFIWFFPSLPVFQAP